MGRKQEVRSGGGARTRINELPPTRHAAAIKPRCSALLVRKCHVVRIKLDELLRRVRETVTIKKMHTTNVPPNIMFICAYLPEAVCC